MKLKISSSRPYNNEDKYIKTPRRTKPNSKHSEQKPIFDQRTRETRIIIKNNLIQIHFLANRSGAMVEHRFCDAVSPGSSPQSSHKGNSCYKRCTRCNTSHEPVFCVRNATLVTVTRWQQWKTISKTKDLRWHSLIMRLKYRGCLPSISISKFSLCNWKCAEVRCFGSSAS